MAIALTPFEALCGFRPWSEIKYFISSKFDITLVCFVIFIAYFYLDIPELQTIVSGAKCGNDKELIQLAFREVLTCPKEKITDSIDSLLSRFSELSEYLKLHIDTSTKFLFR